VILSDRNIISAMENGTLLIDPFTTDRLQPASVDLLLGWTFKKLLPNCGGLIDPKLPAKYDEDDLRIGPRAERVFYLLPGDVVLGTSIERFHFGAGIVGRLEGKSSLARLGLLVHSTAGFFDPGFEGEATLELINMTQFPIKLYPEMKIAQMSFHNLSSPAMRPYGHPDLGSKYIGQTGPTESRMHLNFAETQFREEFGG